MMMKKKNLAKAVTLSVLLMLPYGMAQAQTYTDTIQGGNDKYADEGIRTGNETDGFVYNFQDGDTLTVNKSNVNYYAGIYKYSINPSVYSNGDYVINGKLNINVNQNAEDKTASMGYGIVSNGFVKGDISLQDGANITVTMDKVEALDSGITATGVYSSTQNTISLADSNIKVVAKSKNGTFATAKGIENKGSGKIVLNNGTIEAYAEGGSQRIAADGICVNAANANVELGDVNINAKAVSVDGDYNTAATGISFNLDSGSGAVLTGNNVEINVEANSNAEWYDNTYTVAEGIATGKTGSRVELKNAKINVKSINNADQNIRAYGIDNHSNNEVIISETANIVVEAEAKGEMAYSAAYGVWNNGGSTTIGNGSITATLTNTQKYSGNEVHAVYAKSGTINLGKVDIAANVIGGYDYAFASGITSNGSKSIVNMAGGSINVSAESYKDNLEGEDLHVIAIDAYKGGTVNINKDTANDVVIDGDIQADADSAIVLNLNTKNSVLNGAVQDLLISEGGSGEGIKMTVANGATWNVNNYSDVSNLTVANGGVVDTALMYDTVTLNPFDNLTFTNLDGEGGIFKLNVDGSTNEYNSTRVYIEGVHSGSHIIDINEIGDNMDNAKGTVLVSVKDEQSTFTAQDKENALYWDKYILDRKDVSDGDKVTSGYNTDWILADIQKDTERSTSTVAAIMGANALNYHTWRAENDQLMRRMGELRNNGADEEGAWFRVHGSKISRDDNTTFENEYTTYELGYDQITKQTDDMTRYTGAALSYTDGSSSYDSGSGENHSKAIAFYNTDIYNSGHYLDLVFKYVNMDNDFNVYDTNNNKISGEYKNTGISVSAEYGRKNDLKNGWYVEPQAQLTLGYFGGDEYETSNGISVDQSGIASVLGRVGFNIGKQIGDSGVIYAKANLLHEFAGDYDIDMTDSNGISRSESESFNDTWFEYGVGAALKTGKNNHLYFDFVKTAGGDFEKDWQWNAGMRWTF